MFEVKTDELGPLKFIHLYSKKGPLRAILVVDNITLGPAIGGVRVSLSVTPEEIQRLARTMTLKNAIAGIPHGGGKSGIIADPKSPDKEHYFRIFAKLIKEVSEYIPGPDMGSNEECMAWIEDETGRAVGLPRALGGLPLDQLGATGFGLAQCAEVAAPYAGLELKGARIIIEGLGNVGRAAAKYLVEKGAILISANDSKGTIYNPEGLDLKELLNIKKETGSVINYKKGRRMAKEEIFSIECDILIPAATPDVINEKNVSGIKTKMVLEGANIPATFAAEEALSKRGILVVPDFIANAGGVIMAAMEYEKRSEKDAFEAISDKIRENTALILEESKKKNVLPRVAAGAIARERVLEAEKYRDF